MRRRGIGHLHVLNQSASAASPGSMQQFAAQRRRHASGSRTTPKRMPWHGILPPGEGDLRVDKGSKRALASAYNFIHEFVAKAHAFADQYADEKLTDLLDSDDAGAIPFGKVNNKISSTTRP